MDAFLQRRQRRRSALYALSVSLLSCASPPAIAASVLPTGGNFAAGSGKISSTANTSTVNQTTKNGIINWNGFSIGQGNSVRINNGSGATLNRVTGASPSSIAGSLTSSGSTYLINQNGIVVTPSGKVITGGTFVGSTRDTSNSAFMRGGNLQFTGTSPGMVTNQGSITAGGDAVLIGKSATNSGSISAPNGVAGVVAGDDVVLQPSGSGLQIEVKTGSGNATTSGNVAAAQALIDAAGGNAYALAGNNGGQVRATGTRNINGHVWLTAPNGAAQVTATVSAQNADGSGGAIDIQGQSINVSGALNASDMPPKGNGGTISVGSATTPSTTVSGTLTARGGAQGGNGGHIETSGEVLNTSGIKVDTTAPKGQTGNWTLDPYNVTISSAATSSNALSSGTFTPSGNDSVISVSDLQNALQTTNVTVTTGTGGSQTGDITVASPVAWSANVLTVDAYHSININAALSASGTAGLVLKINDGGSGGGLNFAPGNISFANTSEALTINGIAQTLVAAALTGSVTKTYDGTNVATLTQSNYTLTGVAPADQNSVVLTVNGTADSSATSGTFSTKDAGTALPVTVSGLGLNQPGGDTYFLTAATISANIGTINPASLTVTASSRSKVYGTADPALTYTVSGLLSGDTADSVLNGSLSRASYGTLAGEQVGSYAISQGSLVTNGNYTIALAGSTLSITPATVLISPYMRNKVYGNNDPAFGYDVSQLVYGVVDGVVIQDTPSIISGSLSRAGYGTLAGEQVGSYAITQGSLVANSDYNVSIAASTLNINPATLSVTAHSATKVYGTGDPVFTYSLDGLRNSVADGVVINDTASVLTGRLARAAGENTGSYGITQGSLAASNYSIDFTGSALSITPANVTVTANPQSKVYGTSDPVLSFSTSGLVNATVDGVSINDTAASVFTGSLARAGGENTGSYAISQGNLAANNNYTLTAFTGNSLSITPAILTLTANALSKTYGGNDPTLTYSTSGLVNATVDGFAINDTADSVLNGVLSRAAYGTLAGEQVGRYAITQGSLTANGDYTIAFTGNSLSITPATVLISPYARRKVYGNSDPAFGYDVSQLVNGIVDGVAINDTAGSVLSGSLSRAGYGTLAGEQVGSYAITQGSLAATSNYTVGLAASTLNITPTTLTVTANGQNKIYGSNDPALTYTTSGFVNATVDGVALNDTAASALTGSLSRAGYGTLAGEQVGSYAITQGSLAANNYSIDFTGSLLSITPASLTVTANPQSKVYGTSDPVLSFSTSGLVNATVDGVSINDTAASVFTGSLARAGGENTGSYAISQGNLAANNNYTLTAFTGNSLSITPAILTLTANALSKTYGGNDPTLTYSTSGLVNATVDGFAINDTADSVLNGVLSRAAYGTLAGEQVGRYAITQGSLTANGDYTIAFTGNSLSITPATVLISPYARRKVYGNSDPAFGYDVSQLVNGIVDGVAINDTAGSVLSGSLSRAGYGTLAGEQVGSYAITQGSLAATSNYTVGLAASTLNITPTTLTVTANGQNKIYGSNDPALTYTTSGFVNATVDGIALNDTAASALTGSLARAAGENTGSYAITQGSLAANGDYTISFNGDALSISPASLTVTANRQSKTYGTSDPGLTYSTSGLVHATIDGIAINDTAASVLTGSLARDAGENAGSYAINQGSLAANNNYAIAFAGNSLNIAPAALTVTARPQSKAYGGNDPTLTYTTSGLVNATVDGFAINDTADSVLSGGLSRAGYGTLAGEQVGSYAINQGSLTANGNYTIAFTGNAQSITPATAVVSAHSRTKTYGNNDPALDYDASQLVYGIVDGVTIHDTAASVFTGSLARAAGENAGSYAITQGNLAANNYTIAFTGNSLNISPATLTVTADGRSKSYGSNDPALTYNASGLVNATIDGVAIHDTAATVLSGSLARAGGENAGSYAIGQGSLAANSNYTIAAFDGNSLSITPRTLTVSADARSKVYGSNDPALTYATSGLVNATVDGFAINDTVDSVLSGGLARAAGENVGSYAISQGSLAANGNYTIAFIGNTQSITPATVLISPYSRSKVYGNTDPALGYDVSQLVNGTVDGIAIHDTAASVLSGSLSRAGYGTSAGEQVGSYAITQGSLAATSNYTVALASSTLNINPATLSVTADGRNKTYGSHDPALTYTTSGLVNATVDGAAINDSAGSVLTGSLARATGENAGSYAITQGSLAANRNYTIDFTGNALNITPASLNVTVNGQSKLYGTSDPGLTYSVSGLQSGDSVATVLSGSLARNAGENAGSYAIGQGSLAANNNYAIAFTGNSLSISPKTLTVTADARSKVYGAHDPALTYTTSSFVNTTVDGVVINDTAGSVLSGGLSRAGYGTLAGEQAGSYAITQGSLTANDNYTIAFIGSTQSITPATALVTAYSRTKTYGNNDPALGYDASQLVDGVIDGVAINDTPASVFTGSLARAAGENAGSYAITQGSLAANGNYHFAFTGSSLNIVPAPLTVKADGRSKIYGTNDPSLTYTASGFVNAIADGTAINDTAASVLNGSLGRTAGENAGSYAIGQGSLATNGNYAIAFIGNSLNITPAALSVTADARSKTYGNNDPALTYSTSGLVNATVDGTAIHDTAASAFTGALGRAAGENSGSYAITQGNLASNNYAISFTGNSLSITPATLNVTANGRSKIYGTNDPALTYTTSGLVSGPVDGVAINDTAATVLTGSLARAAGENTGGYTITRGNLAANGNYNIAFTGNSLNIAPATLTVTADAKSKAYGSNDPALTYTASGLVNTTVDGTSITDTAASVLTGALSRDGYGTLAGEQAGGHAINQGTLASNSNYAIVFTGSNLAISPASLTVAAHSKTKTYGTSDPALTYDASGFVHSTADGVAINDTAASSLTGSLARSAGESAGNYAIGQGSLAASNYAIAFTGNSLSVTPATLTVAANSEGKTYGTTDPALTYSTSGLVNATVDGTVINDTAASVLSGRLTRGAGENAGSYAIGQGSLAANGNYTIAFTGNALSISPAALTVAASAESKTYGNNDPALAYTTSGLVNATVDGVAVNDTVGTVLTGSLARPAGENTGSYTIGQGSLAANGNYTINFTGNSLNITPANLTVAARLQSKNYGSSDPALTYDASGLVSATVDGVVINDTTASAITGSLARAGYGTFGGEQVGGYAINQGTLAANSNYVMTFTGSNLAVNPVTLTVAALPNSKTYGDNDPALTYATAGLVTGTADGIAINDTAASVLTGRLARAAGESAGSYTVTQGNLAANRNYTIAFTSSLLSIAPATLTVTANSGTKVYGTSDPGLTYRASGLVNATVDGVVVNDTATSVLTGRLARAAGENVGTYAINQGNLAANGNYTIAFTGNSLSVTPASLTITATRGNKVYDGTTSSSLMPTYTGLVAGDSLTGLTQTYDSKDVAGATTLSVASFVLSDPANYHVTTNTASGTITPATLIYVADAQSILYSQSIPTVGGTVSGFVAGENLSNATSGTTIFATNAAASSAPGQYAVNGSGLAAKHGNYVFEQAATNATALTINYAVTLAGGNLSATNWNLDDLGGVDFSGADLAGANLHKTNLTDANLSNTVLTGANLHGAVLTGATVSTVSSYTVPTLTLGTSLAGQNLSGMNLSGRNLAGYDLSGANLKGANLTGANFTGANLAGVNLSGATLFGANFTDANLAGANLSGAIFH